MFSSLKKVFTSRPTVENVCVVSAKVQPNHTANFSADNRSGEHKLFARNRERKLKSTECMIAEDAIKLVPWKHGQDNRWVQRVMRVLSDKLPKHPATPQLVNGIKFVVDQDGKPIALDRTSHGAIVLVTWKGKLRALKTTYKEMADFKEVIYEAALLKYAARTKATVQFHGLVAIESDAFCKCGILLEHLDLKDHKKKMPTEMSKQDWKKVCLRFCDDVEKLQTIGIRLLDLNNKKIQMHPTKKRLVITDIEMAIYKEAKLLFEVVDVPEETFVKTYSYMAPEIYFNSGIHDNTDIYSLAKFIHSLHDLIGIDTAEMHFILGPFFNNDPSKRPPISLMKSMLAMYCEFCAI